MDLYVYAMQECEWVSEWVSDFIYRYYYIIQ